MTASARYPGIRITANGNQLVSYHTETRIADAGVFYPITPSTEGGELFQQAYAEGHLNVFGHNTIAIETEGEHAAQGGAIAHSVCGKRVVNLVSALHDLMQQAVVPQRKTYGLTPRELEVVGCIVEGCSNRDIAKQFTLSEETVKRHLSNIFDKTGVSTRLELALFAIAHHLVTPQQ